MRVPEPCESLDGVDGPRSPARCAITWSLLNTTMRGAVRHENTKIGLDLAKHWFQVHGIDAAGKVIVKRRLRRAEVIQFFQGL